ncbi:MAG: hypothetical protein ABFD44_10515 [Anaerolineaceae bacterium]
MIRRSATAGIVHIPINDLRSTAFENSEPPVAAQVQSPRQHHLSVVL